MEQPFGLLRFFGFWWVVALIWRRWRRAGSARPTGDVRIRLTACFGSVLLRGTPGTAFPTEHLRIRRGLERDCGVAAGMSGTPSPTGVLPLSFHFSPPGA